MNSAAILRSLNDCRQVLRDLRLDHESSFNEEDLRQIEDAIHNADVALATATEPEAIVAPALITREVRRLSPETIAECAAVAGL